MNQRGTFLDAATLRFVRTLPGAAADVWPYFAKDTLRARWLAGGPMAPRVGGPLTLRFDHAALTPHDETVPERYRDQASATLTGRVTVWQPPHRLAFLWGADTDASEVTVHLSDRAGPGTRLTLTHHRLPSSDETLAGVAAGWHTHLDILEAVLGDTAPPPFWLTHAILEEVYRPYIAERPPSTP